MQQLLIFIKFIASITVSFYTLSIPKNNNGNINFSNFSGKKVLIVNTAINTTDTFQYRKLEQLQQLYKDSLVVIAIPSNDFNNAPMSDSAIKVFLENRYNIHYKLAKKTSVKGNNISILYDWLAKKDKNGSVNSTVKTDFTKYLIDKAGNIVGIFGRTEDPMGANIRNAVEAVY